ncbi:grasp-with-spasm system ATP-grasp peptide maturase [Myxococcus stipitatus]|uniref:grasp-with-spasm system ATP-grasp peptide maturase n=1 Tax=Myxococcus stipitatus TaxID=83455 RepID=UPI0030D1A342
MILLLSTSDDTNLDHVIDWLKLQAHAYLRLNADDVMEEPLHLSLQPPRLAFRGHEVDLSQVGVVWLRKFGNFRRSAFHARAASRLRRESLLQLEREHASLLTALTSLLEDKHWLTHPSRLRVNKVEMLLKAQRSGLLTPETHVLNRGEDLSRLLAGGEYISKSLFEPLFLKEEGGLYSMFTRTLEPEELPRMGEHFFPSLVQRKVEKEYELRVFYLDGECHTMAIFSQQSERTRQDFREIDWTRPTRMVPYALPMELEEAIRRFMRAIGLNCGSLDIIKSTDGGYYFLEVNPSGQFGMVSHPCNSFLYEKIARYLIDHDLRAQEAH